MNEFGFPKQTESQETGRVGETFLEHFVTRVLCWVYRPVPRESDFGIDGYIDIVRNGSVTGRGLAVQIKCGDSYISKATEGGIKYEGKNHHLNFYLNHAVPVVLVVLSSDVSEGYWVEFEAARTNRTGSGWRIEIPRRNTLNASVGEAWSALAGPVEDFSEAVQTLWAVDDLLKSTDFRAFAIPFDEVQQCSMEYVEGLINRLTKNREALLANRGKMEIFFPGYDADPRELYEVPEVRAWFAASIEHGVPWFYFLDTRGRGNSLRLLLFCTCELEVYERQGTQQLLLVSSSEQERWLTENFVSLNRFTEYHDIPIEINKERSDAVVECLYSGSVEHNG